jgi:hypothetical protein
VAAVRREHESSGAVDCGSFSGVGVLGCDWFVVDVPFLLADVYMSSFIRDDIDQQDMSPGTPYLHLDWQYQAAQGAAVTRTIVDVKPQNWDAAWQPVLQAYGAGVVAFNVTIVGKFA